MIPFPSGLATNPPLQDQLPEHEVTPLLLSPRIIPCTQIRTSRAGRIADREERL